MKNATLRIVLALALSFLVSATAADGERDAAGAVTAKSGDSISILVRETKKTETFALTNETQFLRGRETVTTGDVQVGDIALIHAKKIGGQEVATLVATKPRR